MFINPKRAIKEGWLHEVKEEWIQPNGIDIPIESVYEVDGKSLFTLSPNEKTHRDRKEVELDEELSAWHLLGGNVYDFNSSVYVEVPEGIVGWLVTRSTLNRNGVFVHSGLYDSGFKGYVCGMIYNLIGYSHIKEGSTVAQFIMAESDNEGVYAGGYNVNEGEVWHETKST